LRDIAVNNYFGAMLRYFEFSGRSTRREYWWFSLGFVVAIAVALYIDIKFLNSENLRSSVLVWFVLFTHAVPNITLLVRRLHDTGKSGWWYWIALIPFVGGLLLFYFVAIKGPEYEAQRYGPDPRDPGAFEPAQMRLERHQPLTRAQLMVQQMEERRRRMA
jgi:uncharacterized membrane protein YhaH (DUF805 family)